MPRVGRDALIDSNIATPKMFAPFTNQDSFRYSPTTMSPPRRKGFMVSLGDEGKTKPQQTTELDHLPTEAELASFVAANAEVLKNNDKLYVGGWMETKNKLDAAGNDVLGQDGKPVRVFVKYWLDISEQVDDLATAKKLGYDRGQVAILDAESFDAISIQKDPNDIRTSNLPTGIKPTTNTVTGTGTNNGGRVPTREAELPAAERIIARKGNYAKPLSPEDAGAETTRKWMDSRDPLVPTNTGRSKHSSG